MGILRKWLAILGDIRILGSHHEAVVGHEFEEFIGVFVQRGDAAVFEDADVFRTVLTMENRHWACRSMPRSLGWQPSTVPSPS